MISPITILKISSGHWLFEWSGTGPYEIWLDGIHLASPTTGSYTFTKPGYGTTPPPLEIVEAGTSESEQHPPFLILQWRGTLAASSYSIEEYVSGAWTIRTTQQEMKRGYYQYQTPVLSDGVAAEWRIRPIDAYRNYGAALLLSVKMVHNPTPPSVIITLSSGKIQVGVGT